MQAQARLYQLEIEPPPAFQDFPALPAGACFAGGVGSGAGLPGAAAHIHTGIFQEKIKNFPGLETPPVRSSDLTVQ
jgi:hypothetical protein